VNEQLLLTLAHVHPHTCMHSRTRTGTKSFAAEVDPPGVSVLGYPHLVAARSSEEHLPLRLRDTHSANAGLGAVATAHVDIPPRGTLLYLWPKHICPTVNLHEECVLIDSDPQQDAGAGTTAPNDASASRWNKWSFVPIAARAHDLCLGK
jgi:hypothetical protein